MAVFLDTLAYLVAVFPLAYVWHLVLFKAALEDVGYAGRAEPIVPLGFATILLQGLAIGVAFQWVVNEDTPFASAFAFSAFAILLIWSAQVLAHAAKFEVSIARFVAVETAYFVVQTAAVALLIGAVHRFLV